MADTYTLEFNPKEDKDAILLPLVDQHPKDISQENPPERATNGLPFRFAAVTTTLLDSSTSQGPRESPDAKLFQESSSEFVPPVRPSSTPYPFADTKETSCSSTTELTFGVASRHSPLPTAGDDSLSQHEPAQHFANAPIEVHEAILDYLFGSCVPVSARPSALWSPNTARSLGTALRHSRRREMTQLALVNPTWKILVQKRLYRHIKLKGTARSINQALMHFASSTRLASYVKHIEVWFPVFQPRHGPLALSNTALLPLLRSDGLTTATYLLPGNNCALEDVFRFVGRVLPQTKILTVEGGERRKAPKVVHFHNNRYGCEYGPTLPVVYSITTLITKGQWNLIRGHTDFVNILGALPNLQEWQGAYSKPKSKSYITLSEFIPYLPPNIKNLSFCLENDYRREAVVPAFYAKAAQQTHICTVLGEIMPRLEQLSYTGRICHHFFEVARQSAAAPTSRLRSIDITLKNCCRQTNIFHDSGSGIQDMGFIEAFEKLVISSIRSLSKFQRVEYLRIRFVDLGKSLTVVTTQHSLHC